MRAAPRGSHDLKRAQEVQHTLLRAITQVPVVLDDPVRLRWSERQAAALAGESLAESPEGPRVAATGMRLDRLHQIGRAPVMQQENPLAQTPQRRDRKSTRLNSSHVEISYAVF